MSTEAPRALDVLHVLWEGTGGGAERHVLDLSVGMARQGVRCGVLYLSRDGGAGDILRSAGAGVRCCGLTTGRDPRGPRAVASAVRALRPALLHDHVSVPWLRALLPRVPAMAIAATEHGHVLRSPYQRTGPRLWIERAGARRTRFYIAPSEVVARAVASVYRFPPERIRVIPHGVDGNSVERAAARREVREELKIAQPAILLLFAGRLDETKGTLDLWEAFERAVRRADAPDLYLLMAGRGPLDARLRSAADGSPAGERLRLLGFRRDLARLMAAADLFVLPSRQEALGIVLLEAMASGLPIVATRAGGIPEIVADGETGLLVEPRDPAAMSEAVLRLALDPQRRAALGAAGHERWARSYTISGCVQATLETYEWARALPLR